MKKVYYTLYLKGKDPSTGKLYAWTNDKDLKEGFLNTRNSGNFIEDKLVIRDDQEEYEFRRSYGNMELMKNVITSSGHSYHFITTRLEDGMLNAFVESSMNKYTEAIRELEGVLEGRDLDLIRSIRPPIEDVIIESSEQSISSYYRLDELQMFYDLNTETF